MPIPYALLKDEVGDIVLDRELGPLIFKSLARLVEASVSRRRERLALWKV